MPKAGEAYYELTARDQALLSTLDKAEGRIKAEGEHVEQAFAGSLDRAAPKMLGSAQGTSTRLGSIFSGVAIRIGEGFSSLGGVFAKSRIGGFFDDAAVAVSRFGLRMEGARIPGLGLHAVVDKLGGVSKGLGGILTGLGIPPILGWAAAAAVAVKGITHAIGAASDLNETVSKSAVVFGPAAADLQKWSKGSAEAFGLSQNAALGAAATFGNLFVALKLPTDQVPKMSKGLVELAGDLASFNNVDPTEALDALRSGLVGETEPLRKFGVNVNEATIAQKALSLGLISSTKEAVTPAIKAQATYALILDQTKTAQGDFARTSDGLANQQRIASAKIENAFARVGQALLPIAAKIVPAVADAFSFLADQLSVAFEWIGKVYDFLKPLIDVMWTLAGIVVNTLGGAFKLLGDIVGGVVNLVKPIFDTIVGTIKNVVNTVAGFLASFPNPLQGWAQSVRDSINEVDHAAREDSAQIAPGVAAAVAGGADTVAAGAETGITDPIVDAAVKGRKGAVKEAAATPKEIANSLLDGVFDVQNGVDALKDVMKNTMTKAKEETKLQAFLSSKLLAKALNDSRPEVRAAAEAQKQEAEDRLWALQHDVPAIALKTGQTYADALASKHDEVDKAAQTALAGVRGRLTALQADAKTWGSKTGDAYTDGIAAGIVAGTGNVKWSVQKIANIMKAGSPPGPESPLHLIDVWGFRTMAAWADGMVDAGPGVAEKVKAVAAIAGRALGINGPTLAVSPALQNALPQPAPARTNFGALGVAAGVSGGSSVSVGDVHLHVDVDKLVATDRAQVADLARQLASEVRLALVQTPVAARGF